MLSVLLIIEVVSHHTVFPLFHSFFSLSNSYPTFVSAVVLPESVFCNAEYCDEDSSFSVLCSGVDSNIEITCYYDGDTEPSHPCKSTHYLYYRGLDLSSQSL